MLDKSLVKKRFQKSYNTYDDNAVVQKMTAKKLVSLLNSKNFDSIFEIGSATGVLTKEIKNNLTYKSFYANDIVEDSKEYISNIDRNINFITGDIENIEIDKKFDLIISNASLQWCNDIKSTLNKLLNSLNNNGLLAITVFGDFNLKEINEIFKYQNKTNKIIEIKDELKNHNIKYYEEEKIELIFNSPIDVLRHLKLTGVNATQTTKFTKETLKAFEQNYISMFTKDSGVTLTYNPVYIVIKNSISS